MVVHTWGLTAFRSSATVETPSGVWSSLSLKWSPCTLAAWQVWHLISYAELWSQGQWLGSHCVDLCQHLVADWAWRLLVFREGGKTPDSCWQYHRSYHGLLCYPWVPGAWNPGWTRRMDCLILVDMGLKWVTQTQYGPSVPFGRWDEDESSVNLSGQEEHLIEMLDCLDLVMDQQLHNFPTYCHWKRCWYALDHNHEVLFTHQHIWRLPSRTSSRMPFVGMTLIQQTVATKSFGWHEYCFRINKGVDPGMFSLMTC